MDCELCERDGGSVLWRDAFCRIVRVSTRDYPGYCRVILNRHASEMTDLGAGGVKRFGEGANIAQAVVISKDVTDSPIANPRYCAKAFKKCP